MDSIPSIPEHAARGEIAALYTDIRQTLQVPTTNLIWRHLATLPGALAGVWVAIKPLYLDGSIDSAAAGLEAFAPFPAVTKWSERQLATAGISQTGLPVVRAVLENYARTNPANLIALNAVLAQLEGRARVAADAGGDRVSRSRAPLQPLPELVPESDMTPTVRVDANRLNRIGLEPPPATIIAGVPRHLAQWPGFLRLAVELLEPIETEIGVAIGAVQNDARRRGEGIAAMVPDFSDAIDGAPLIAALAQFTAVDLIANYIVKVRLLMAALPE